MPTSRGGDRYSAKQVANMMINPYVLRDIYEAYPYLKAFVDEEDKPLPSQNWDRYWRFVALVYDPGSPMAVEFPDLDDRKTTAAKDVGMNLIRDEEYRQMALKYVLRCNKPVATLLTCCEMVFADYAQKVIATQDGSDRDALAAQEMQGKMLDRMYDMVQRIAELRKILWGGDKKLEETADEYWRPEQIASKTAKKKAAA